jgi:hypothetical protein
MNWEALAPRLLTSLPSTLARVTIASRRRRVSLLR